MPVNENAKYKTYELWNMNKEDEHYMYSSFQKKCACEALCKGEIK
jgi:hypothetical protein